MTRQGTKPRAVAYLRQSTHREESISLELQEIACRDYCKRNGYEVVAVEADPGISGRTWKRPAVQKVMTMIEAGEAEVVVLWKWSRLSRRRLDWAVAADRVEQAGGKIESATEPIDVTTSSGRFARGMMTEVAAFESERIGDGWKEAHARRVAQGRPASGRARFGYLYDRDQKLHVPDPETGPVLKEMYRRYLDGYSVYALSEWANLGESRPIMAFHSQQSSMWTATTIRRILDSGFAAGYFLHQGELHKGIHEALISEDDWNRYRARRESRRVLRRSERSSYLLTGMIRCECGGSMQAGQFGAAREPKYRCSRVANSRAHTGGYIMAKFVEREVYEWVKKAAEDLESIIPERETPKTSNLPALHRKVISLDAKLDSATMRLLDGTIPQAAYERVRDELIGQKSVIEKTILAEQVNAAKPASALLPGLSAGWDELEMEPKREVLRQLIDYIEVKPGRPRGTVTIHPKW